jgi:site-specific recombinase XerD
VLRCVIVVLTVTIPATKRQRTKREEEEKTNKEEDDKKEEEEDEENDEEEEAEVETESRHATLIQEQATKAHEWNRMNGNQNTRRTYDSVVKQFDEWCVEKNVRDYMKNDATVARYLQWMVEKKKSARSSLHLVVAAIKDKYKYTEENMTDTVLVKATLKIASTKTKKKKPKKPLTVTMMKKIVDVWASQETHTFNQTRNVFLILLMMAAFLRESEAVELALEDMKIENAEVDGKERRILLVHVKKAKNDQEKNGHVVMLGESMNNSKLCVVKWYERYMMKRGKEKKNRHLFVTHEDEKMAKTTPSGILKKAVESIGENPNEYGSHSARIGGTTEASKSGIAVLLLKRHGNWRSDVVYDYIRQSLEDQLSVTDFLDH